MWKVPETSYSTSKLGVGVMVSKTPVGDKVRHYIILNFFKLDLTIFEILIQRCYLTFFGVG